MPAAGGGGSSGSGGSRKKSSSRSSSSRSSKGSFSGWSGCNGGQQEASRGFHDSGHLTSETLVMGVREKGPEEGREPGVQPLGPEELRAAVESLVEKVRSRDEGEVRAAVGELRLRAKTDAESRAVIGSIPGSIPALKTLLACYDARAQADAVTALLNLSIHGDNRAAIIALEGAAEAVAEVIRTGRTWEARENAAALLSSLLVEESFREAAGRNAAALGALRGLLFDGRARGRKDAVHALFHLALWPRNRARIVAAGVVAPLRIMLGSGARDGLVEDTLALLTQVAKCPEGADAVSEAETVALVVGHMESGPALVTENATSLLLSLCRMGGAAVQSEVRRHRATVLATSRATLMSGSARGKARANDLVKMLADPAPFSSPRIG